MPEVVDWSTLIAVGLSAIFGVGGWLVRQLYYERKQRVEAGQSALHGKTGQQDKTLTSIKQQLATLEDEMVQCDEEIRTEAEQAVARTRTYVENEFVRRSELDQMERRIDSRFDSQNTMLRDLSDSMRDIRNVLISSNGSS
mgnify:CR=1 FL=1